MIVGFKLKKVLAEKLFSSKEEKAKPIKITNVSTKTDIIDVSEQKIEIKDQDAINLDFSFEVNYEPKIAKIIIEGQILSVLEKNKAKEILDSWKKKELPKEVRLEAVNFILAKCSIKALDLEESMNLPPHFPLPRFQLKEPKGQDNKEKGNTNYAG